MYQRVNKQNLVVAMLLTASITVGTGCTDNNFDLSNIDATIGLGGEQLQLPSSSTESIKLDNVLKLNNSDLISIAENGDYQLTKEGENIERSHPSISQLVVREAKIDDNFKIEIPANVLSTKSAKGMKRTKLSTPVQVEGKAAEFHYKGNVPNEIRELESATTTSELTIQVKVTDQLRQVIPTFKALSINLPSYLKLTIGKCQPAQPDYDEAKGMLTFHNIASSSNILIKATVSSIDMNSKGTPENRLVFLAGKGTNEGSIDLNGVANINVLFDEVNMTGTTPNNLFLSARMTMDPIVVSEAKGKFSPTIDLNDLGGVNINDVPDFLTDNDVTVNLYNPTILLTATSDIDVAGFVSPTLYAEDAQGNTIAQVDIPQIRIKPQAVTRVCICKHPEDIDQTQYDEVVKVDNLSDIVKRIPKRIRCEAEAHADASRMSTLKLNHQYTINVNYFVSAPLAFDEGAQIVYTDSIDGWNEDIDPFSFAEGAYIEMNADIDNKTPAYLQVKAHAIDVNGNTIPENRIQVKVSNHVKASEDGQTAVTTPISIKLTENEKGALKQVDGIVYRITAASDEEGARSIVGQTINAYKHTLTARNIKIKLVGKIIGDFN